MYKDKNREGMTLTELLNAAGQKAERAKKFPYTKAACRCQYCLYQTKGKCALQTCCCMEERVGAHSCTFSEAMNACFANVRDHVFRYRLRIAIERAAELKTCFLERQHPKRFREGLSRSRRKDNSFAAQIYLLSASGTLWEKTRDCICSGGISYTDVDIAGITPEDYTLYCAAMDFENAGSHTDIEDLSNDEVVDFEVFRAICYAVCINAYGTEVTVISERRKKYRKGKKKQRNHE